jgi:hypothetical protein
MSEIGRLIEVNPREAWPHEALSFTPWLAEHLEDLSDALGVPLELREREVAVENYSADILATNLADNSLVLIENQLEQTDHRHLGQIMTYLAGLQVKTAVWIATKFTEPHLSAIRWLNDHTADEFSFFAVRLRVVRIAASPIAPIFDVLVRPNAWERQLQTVARETISNSELTTFRREFWSEYLKHFPDDAALGVQETGSSSVWVPVDQAGLTLIALWVGRTKLGLFVRGPRGSDGSELATILEPIRDELETRLGAKYGRTTGQYFFDTHHRIDMTDRANWPTAIQWLHGKLMTYLDVLRALGMKGSS